LTDVEISDDQDSRKIELSRIVRGSFILRQIDYPMTGVNYFDSKQPIISVLKANSIIPFETYSLTESADLKITNVKFMFAMDRIVENRRVETIILMKKNDDHLFHTFTISNGTLNLLKTEYNPSDFRKSYALTENVYVLITSDGHIHLYDVLLYKMSELPYPGAFCDDGARLFHPNLRISLICIDVNN